MTLRIGKFIGYTLVYAAALSLAVAYRVGNPEGYSTWVVHAMIFVVGPVFMFLDLRMERHGTRWAHHGETLVRTLLLMWLYAMVLPGLSAPSVSPNGLAPLLNFLVLYWAFNACLSRFVVPPTRWKLESSELHLFLVCIALTCFCLELLLWRFIHGTSVWLLAVSTLLLQMGWRHLLWCDPHHNMPRDQQEDVLRHLEKTNTAQELWSTVFGWSLTRGLLMPTPALGVLKMSTLLNYFSAMSDSNLSHDLAAMFDNSVKAAINAKEPRAAILWGLYPVEEAVEHIRNIDAFCGKTSSAPLDMVELPAL